ncbi:NAD(P)-dependent dehydrogenase, short-chain alcohol dehydrogenase family [Marinobacter persicus]|uniref:NAD(P)-dependent dehydrogenase, short-chain alcohol dehydrogenase family n=1 Tax=Marinobacter persicus TaxID=930118 RepID=A0A1I3VJH9_9GAMM|nr:SDR family oxidoreductase [Marinobacter persicus]GHD51516.1 oxidoreductase [Marinobacter persicus]SFJ95518.1 NAD(P)-dependent dehydrogenase, short-chain alcohol dehydrogenase family [Marinobacter persicus]
MTQQPPAILITGGAQGIGKGIASHFLNKGWRVAVLDRDAEAIEACRQDLGEPDNLSLITVDVSREPDVIRALAEAMEWAVRLDALVNNAGIPDPETGPIETLELSEWQRRIDVNLTGAFLMAKHTVPHLRKNQGSIVNIASTRALQSEPNCEAYAASKGGLIALTHSLAISLGPDVRANSISPGWIDVRAWQANAPANPEPLSASDRNQHPSGRVGTPEDVAAMVAYLVSPEARFVTGQNFVIDGGMTRKMIYED